MYRPMMRRVLINGRTSEAFDVPLGVRGAPSIVLCSVHRLHDIYAAATRPRRLGVR